MHYQLIVCGGTFDLLHKGHKKFLQDVLNLSERVLLGITSDSYVAKFKNEQVEDFEIRKGYIVDFLSSINAVERVETVSINQAYEPLLTTKFSPKAIVVTAQTKKTALEINKKRKELGLAPLEIVVVPMENAEDGGLISSSRIRNGEINRDGRLYVQNQWKTKTLILPQNLRPVLQKPMGRVLNSVPEHLIPEKSITIGDIASQKFNEKNINQFLSIVDFAVHRKRKFEKLSDLGFVEDIETIEAENPAGSVNSDLFDAVSKAFQTDSQKVILVKGEEDLAVLPVILTAPLGFVIFYGQPDEGLVEVKVTEENKEKAYSLVSKFTS